jgi:CDP-glycerol glycerophosphotransferase (TagB/SpsB family)
MGGDLKRLYQPTLTLLLCGDFNINFLMVNSTKQKLILMKTSNLDQVLNFPRVANNKTILMDSFFLDMKYNSIVAYPFKNGLSDHDAQIIILDNLSIFLHKMALIKKVQLINDQTQNNFQSVLWE